MLVRQTKDFMSPLPELVQHDVRARCPDCQAITVFHTRGGGRDFGYVAVDRPQVHQDKHYLRAVYKLLSCGGCGRGGVAKLLDANDNVYVLVSFHPHAMEVAKLPSAVPEGIRAEFKEAELCASVGAWRAASALSRSVLEKTLKANGYKKGSLQQKIDDAAEDGAIAAARRKKAHDDIRTLGNEVVHDEWRAVEPGEVEAALHYAQRVLEDLYDDRDTIEALLKEKGRLT